MGPLAKHADPDPHDVAIDGVAQPHLDPAALDAAGDQSLVLEGLDRGGVGEPGQCRLAERFAEGEQLQHGPLGDGEIAQALCRQLDQARRRTKRPLKAPDAAVIDQRAGLERPGHELARRTSGCRASAR